MPTGEVVEFGTPEREPGQPRTRGRGLAFGAVAVLLLGAVGYAATRPEPAPRSAPRETPSRDAGPRTTFAGGGWRLATEREPTGLALATVVDGTIVVVYADTGRRTTVPSPHAQEDVTAVEQIEGGWLIAVQPDCPADCPSRWYVRRGERTFFVGEGESAWSDQDGRSFWVAGRSTTREWVERRTLSGGLVGARLTLAEGEMPYGVTSGGLLVGTYARGAAVVDRETLRRRTVLRNRIVVDVAGDEVATTDARCTERCPLRVTNLRTGRERLVNLFSDRGNVTMDPSARYLAMTPSDGSVAVRVFELSSGLEVSITGFDLPPRAEVVEWSPDGRWLVLAHRGADGNFDTDDLVQVVAWRPGLEQPFALPEMPGSAFDVTVAVAT